jgi:lipoprotein
MMRNCTFVVTLLALFFTGCEEATIKVGKDFLSHKTNEFDITIAYPVFTSQKAEVERECKMVNEEISRLIDSLQNDLKAQLNEYLQKASDMKEEPMIPFGLDVKDSVFMADRHYISVRLAVYTLTGGANGLTEYYAVNYSLKDKRFLSPEGILNYDKIEIDKQIQRNFKNPENCFSEVPTLANVTTVNFSGNDICFTYNPLVLGAHYCGAAEISVPRMLLKGDLLLK